MPSYGYICPDCGNFSEINTIKNRSKSECPNCGKICERDVEYELNSGSGLNVVTDNYRWSISMGVPPSQVNEFRKRFPKSTYRDDGKLLVKNRRDKLRQAKERGMVELNDIKQ